MLLCRRSFDNSPPPPAAAFVRPNRCALLHLQPIRCIFYPILFMSRRTKSASSLFLGFTSPLLPIWPGCVLSIRLCRRRGQLHRRREAEAGEHLSFPSNPHHLTHFSPSVGSSCFLFHSFKCVSYMIPQHFSISHNSLRCFRFPREEERPS